ncbi:MAG TPA: squalene synthase HpnC [Jatrophihabitantaceae bacterium]|nr:squalene synthase HpnC [Jatrophihabitantaceae bacterium]
MTRAARPDAFRVLTAVADRSAAQIAAENFPVALRVLPRHARSALTAVYTYARFVDDVGDEAPGDRLALLDAVADEVHGAWQAMPTSLAPVTGLQPWIGSAGLQSQPFLDLIEANRLDQRQKRYSTFDDLMGYCRLSAVPIGRIVLRLADADDERNVADSDSICAALQVLEHCQDVGEDARMGRVYLPQDDLAEEGVADAQLEGTTTPSALRSVVAREVRQAEELMAAGAPLVRRLSGWSRLAVAGYLAGGQATAAALRAADYDVLSRTIKAAKLRTVGLLAKRVVGR